MFVVVVVVVVWHVCVFVVVWLVLACVLVPHQPHNNKTTTTTKHVLTWLTHSSYCRCRVKKRSLWDSEGTIVYSRQHTTNKQGGVKQPKESERGTHRVSEPLVPFQFVHKCQN